MTWFNDLDRHISTTMARLGVPALRVSLAIIFIWFGILKPLGLSPAAALVEATVGWMPFFTRDALPDQDLADVAAMVEGQKW